MRVGGLFDGIGLLAYGLHLAGLEHAWLCEVDPWRRSVLAKRWPGVPVFGDVRAVGARSAERVDIVAGGFPCKGASVVGKRNGFEHPETVLWREMARAVRELRPRYVLVENVANILGVHDGAVWGEVVGDLAALGYDTVWDCLPAAAVGAPHLRDRVLAVAALAEGDGRSALEPAIQQPRLGPVPRASGPAAADPRGDGVRQQPVAEPGGDGAPVAARSGEAIADAAVVPEREPSSQAIAVTGGGDTRQVTGGGGGLAVEWGDYGPAITRWEATFGPAPEPLVRRVDARSAQRVDRSRLSALGDGVQVQVGQLAGAYIIDLEARRLAGEGLDHAA